MAKGKSKPKKSDKDDMKKQAIEKLAGKKKKK